MDQNVITSKSNHYPAPINLNYDSNSTNQIIIKSTSNCKLLYNVYNKHAELEAFLSTNNIELLTFCLDQNFQYRKDRNRHGGGVFIQIKDIINFRNHFTVIIRNCLGPHYWMILLSTKLSTNSI